MQGEFYRWMSVGGSVVTVFVCVRHLASGERFFGRTQKGLSVSPKVNAAWAWGFTAGAAIVGVGMAMGNWYVVAGGGTLFLAPILRFLGPPGETTSGPPGTGSELTPKDEAEVVPEDSGPE